MSRDSRKPDSRITGVVQLQDVEVSAAYPGQPQLLLIGGTEGGPGGVLLLRTLIDPARLRKGTRYRLTLEPINDAEVER